MADTSKRYRVWIEVGLDSAGVKRGGKELDQFLSGLSRSELARTRKLHSDQLKLTQAYNRDQVRVLSSGARDVAKEYERQLGRGFFSKLARDASSAFKDSFSIGGIGGGGGIGGIIGGALSVAGGNLITSLLSGVKDKVADAIKTGFDFNRVREQTLLGFEIKLKGRKEAEDFFNQIVEFAKEAEQELPQVLDSTQRLMSAFNAPQALQSLKAITDRVAATGKTGGEAKEAIDGIALALQQVIYKNRLAGQEVVQMAERQVNAYKYIADEIAKTDKQFAALTDEQRIGRVAELAEKGLLNARASVAAIIRGLEKEFGGTSARIAKETLSGIESNTSDRMSQLSGKATAEAFEAYKNVRQKYLDVLNSATGESIAKGINDTTGLLIKGLETTLNSDLQSLGMSAFSSAAEGIKKAGSFLYDAGAGVFSAAEQGWRDAADQHSPSKVMFDLGFGAGQSLMTGFVQGASGRGLESEIERRVEALRRAIIGQESGGRSRIVNRHSGATGLGQVLQSNIPTWTREALGESMSVSDFRNNPAAQNQTITFKLRQYFNEELQNAGGDVDLAMRRVAARWYSGRANLHTSTRPQGRYPSISAYSSSVTARAQSFLNSQGDFFDQYTRSEADYRNFARQTYGRDPLTFNRYESETARAAYARRGAQSGIDGGSVPSDRRAFMRKLDEGMYYVSNTGEVFEIQTEWPSGTRGVGAPMSSRTRIGSVSDPYELARSMGGMNNAETLIREYARRNAAHIDRSKPLPVVVTNQRESWQEQAAREGWLPAERIPINGGRGRRGGYDTPEYDSSGRLVEPPLDLTARGGLSDVFGAAGSAVRQTRELTQAINEVGAAGKDAFGDLPPLIDYSRQEAKEAAKDFKQMAADIAGAFGGGFESLLRGRPIAAMKELRTDFASMLIGMARDWFQSSLFNSLGGKDGGGGILGSIRKYLGLGGSSSGGSTSGGSVASSATQLFGGYGTRQNLAQAWLTGEVGGMSAPVAQTPRNQTIEAISRIAHGDITGGTGGASTTGNTSRLGSFLGQRGALQGLTIGAGIGRAFGRQSRAGQILGMAGGALFGAAAGSIAAGISNFGLGVTLATTSALTFATAGIGGALLLGAALLGRNAARRRAAQTRDTLGAQLRDDAYNLVSEVQRGGYTLAQANAAYERLKAEYRNQVNAQVRDSKEKRNAILYLNDLDKAIKPLLEKAVKAGQFTAQFSPTFAEGGGVWSAFGRDGGTAHPALASMLGLQPFGSGIVSGAFANKRDDRLIRVSSREIVLTEPDWKPLTPYLKARRVKGFEKFNEGGAVDSQEIQQSARSALATRQSGATPGTSSSVVPAPPIQITIYMSPKVAIGAGQATEILGVAAKTSTGQSVIADVVIKDIEVKREEGIKGALERERLRG